MKNMKITALILILSTVFSLVGCSDCDEDVFENTYNATLYSMANDWIDEGFLYENRVKAYYLNENYIEGESDPNESIIYDESSPSFRTFIIKDQKTFDGIFIENSLAVDFEKQIVILYISSNVYPSRTYSLKKMSVDNQVLTVQLELEYKEVDDASMPFQRCFVIVMDSVDISEVIVDK